MVVSRPRKRFGQHWLRSEKVLEQILRAAQLQPQDCILEIGPGTGILTRRLLPDVAAVVAVEIDRDLCQQLRQSLGPQGNLALFEADFLNFALETHLQAIPRPNKVVANIPYNITGPILEKLLGTISQPAPQQYDSIVLLLQKEVGDRLVAAPGSKTFGALSVRMQYLATCEFICEVPAKAFYPPPQVDSVVVRLRPRSLEPPARHPRHLETLIKLGFASRRKMLRNNLKTLIPSDALSQLLEQLNLDPQARAENLSLNQWIALSDRLSEMNHF